MSKQMKLLSLTLSNFKGIREFKLDAAGQNVSIFGDNATGKTTLFDAFIWLLFDKDSQNKKDFDIKTLDQNNKVIHGLEHEVEGDFEVNGKRVTLRKVYYENWTKKRGSASSEFTGHTTDYFINSVPVKKKEYTEQVNEIVDEDIFKLLTSPTYFNEQLPWKDRRKILLEVSGDVSDGEVIASNIALARLPEILGSRSIEDHRKIIAAKRSEINKELEKIPIRIDEVYRSIPDLSGLNEDDLFHQMDRLELKIGLREEELQRIQTGGEIAVKEKRLREIEGELLQIKNQLQSGTLDKVTAKRQAILTIKGDTSELQRQINDKKRTIERNVQWITEKQSEAGRLRQKWHEVNGESYTQHHDENCPACGQSLPEEQVKAAHEKALANFNRQKAERLEEITSKGKAATADANRLTNENETLEIDIQTLSQQGEVKQEELRAAESELIELEASVKVVDTDPLYLQKKSEALSIEQDIQQLRESVQASVAMVRQDISTLRLEANYLEQEHVKFAQVKSANQRIEDLKNQEKKLAAEFEQLEQELYLTEEFIRTKVNLLEEKINNKFKYARFKLFEEQINGGLAEVCETLYKGVPYSTGLNNAARINVGLDIINTLSEHYGLFHSYKNEL